MGFAKPMLYATVGSLIVYVISVFLGPETRGKQMTAELEVFEAQESDGPLNGTHQETAGENPAVRSCRPYLLEEIHHSRRGWPRPASPGT